MYMIPFHTVSPRIAEMETREMLLFSDKNQLKKGKYSMFESYCNDPNCDCRRVFINVIYNDEKPLATIGYGWEDINYYKKFTKNDKELSELFKGPILEVGGFNSRYSNAILKLFKSTMMNDITFMNRLKEHYKIFKNTIKKKHIKSFSETDSLKKAIKHESNEEYTKASNEISKIIENNPNSYHGLFLNARISRTIGKVDLETLENAYVEATKQNASKEVFELFEKEVELSNVDKNKFMKKINQML